ncbi:MAG: condensation protein [Methanocalculus sp. MSAO_Arc2]|uniref:condensation domain-containing protein n=1 Tax=Methanocalculus sp. MSAO_Arc2 TaxID=2293855 RepID=UPI000FEDF0DB|nr:MAG: condensation protein [Methanocalculus sp. MSAO_Arc2]
MNGQPPRYPAPAFDVFNVYFEQIYDPTLHLIFTFDGEIDEDVMQIATMRLIASNPYLRSRFAEADDVPVWEEIPPDAFEGAFACIHVAERGRMPPDDVPAPLDIRSGPQVRVTLYRGEDGDRICVTCHHGFCDATGALVLGKELFSVYRKVMEDPDYIPPPTGAYDRATDRILALYTEEERIEAIEAEEPFVDRWRFPTRQPGRGRPRVSRRILSEERLSHIKACGKRYGATVNDVLISAFFLAFYRIRDDPDDLGAPRSILTAADMRRQLDDPGVYLPMNLSVAFEITVNIDENAQLEDILDQVTGVTSRRKAGGLGPACISFYEGILSGGLPAVRSFFDEMITNYSETGLKNPVFSNLGIIDPNDYLPVPGKNGSNFDLSDCTCIPCVCWPYGFLVVAYTFRNQVVLITAYEEGPYSRETVERFLEYMDDCLP